MPLDFFFGWSARVRVIREIYQYDICIDCVYLLYIYRLFISAVGSVHLM